jgi:hypothetical protein
MSGPFFARHTPSTEPANSNRLVGVRAFGHRVGAISTSSFAQLGGVVLRFADAFEGLLHREFAHPFNIGSDALRDCASNESHQGTETKQILTTLSTSQVRAGFVQCDLYRGIAAGLPADKVFFSPFPLARTSIVVATKAWFLLDADSRETRLQRYLNEELEALHDAPFDPDDEASRKYVETRTADYLAIGATADLRLGLRKNPKSWHAPFLVHSGQRDTEAPASETQLVRKMFLASGFGSEDDAGMPYSLLSAATHGRFNHAGLSEHTPVGPSENGVTMSALHTSLDVTARVTVLSAITTLTYLRALARYMNVPQGLVRQQLQEPTLAWSAIAKVQVPEWLRRTD